MIEVAGIRVPRHGMIEVAHRLVLAGELEPATRVLDGLAHYDRITLEITDREAILRVLEDCPDDLTELRAVLASRAHLAPARRARLVRSRPLGAA